MHPDHHLPRILWLILAAALALRLFGAARANLIFDERAHLALAQTIDLRPGHLHLVSRTLDHPFLSIYVVKLSSLLFGSSDFGLRMLHVLAGTATLVPVYFLGKRVFSDRAGLWAAALLAVDQFHASWSRVFMPEVLMLLFATLALLQLLRALESDRTGSYALLGVLLGLAYLAKEPAILLVPAVWIYLLITPQHRRLLSRPQWYLANGVFLLVIAPDVVWNLALGTESYLYRDAAFVAEPVRLSLKSFSLYLYDAFRWLLPAHLDDAEYLDGNAYACHPAAGVLYLAAVLWAIHGRRQPAFRLLLVVFSFVFGVFLVMPGGGRFEPFWWASLSLVPAVVCAGRLLDRASDAKVLAQAAFLLVGCLTVVYLAAVWRPGTYAPRASVADFVEDFNRRAHAALGREDLSEADLHEAHRRFIYMLNIGGPDADAYYGLGLVADRRGRPQQARSMLEKCLQLDPQHEAALQLGERIP